MLPHWGQHYCQKRLLSHAILRETFFVACARLIDWLGACRPLSTLHYTRLVQLLLHYACSQKQTCKMAGFHMKLTWMIHTTRQETCGILRCLNWKQTCSMVSCLTICLCIALTGPCCAPDRSEACSRRLQASRRT